MPPTPRPKKKRLHPALRALLYLFLTLAFLATAAFLWVRWDESQGRKAWEAYQAEAIQRGVKFDVRDFLRPPIADTDNFAASPLFQIDPVTRKLKDPFTLPPRNWIPKVLKLDAASQLEAARTDFVEKGWIARNDPTSTPAALAKALTRYEVPWAELRRAAEKPDAQFAVPWESIDSDFLPLDHLMLLSSAGKIAQLRVQINLVESHPADALFEWQLLWRLAQTMQYEPTLNCNIFKTGLESNALALVAQGLELHAWTAAELEEIDRSLGSVDLLADFVWSYSSERAARSFLLLHFKDLYLADFQRLNPNAELTFTERYLGIYHSVLQLSRDFDYVLSQFDIAQHRYTARKYASEPLAAFEWIGQRRYRLYSIFAIDRWRIVTNTQYLATRLDQARVACTLERHRLAHGAYPETLTALVPQFLKAIPHDLFDGQPLRYQRRGENFVLYSIGPDLEDNHGITKQYFADSPDWAWGMPAK
jgi:hypothetical protein